MNRSELIQTHERLLYSLAHKHYTHLPPAVRAVLDVDDLYHEACHHALKIADKYDATRNTTFVTFLYSAVNNRLHSIVSALVCGKRYAPQVVPLDEPGVYEALPAAQSTHPIGAESRVNSLLEKASPSLLHFLRSFVFHGGAAEAPHPGAVLSRHREEVDELRFLAVRLNVQLEDFLACQGACIR